MAITDTPDVDESDVALIRRTRAGDAEAYGKLHTRHEAAALAAARRMSRSAADADDLVSEGFARVLAALQRGAGPDVAFRPYLLSAIRRLAYDRTNREQREAPVEYDMDGSPSIAGDPVVEGFERDTAAAAFASLPERWRMVLWHTEVEGQNATEVAALLGMKPNAVAALAYRAREGLRQAYLSQHATAGVGASLECRAVNERLAAYIRDGLGPAQHARVRDHLDDCEDCAAAYLELTSVNTSLKGLVGFVVLGPLWAAYAKDAAGLMLSTAGTATAAAAGGAAASGAGVVGSGTGSGGAAAASAWWPPKPGVQVAAAVVAVVLAVAVGAMALGGFGGGDEPERAERATSPPVASPGDPDPGQSQTPDPAPATVDDPGDETVAPAPGPEPNASMPGAPGSSTPVPAIGDPAPRSAQGPITAEPPTSPAPPPFDIPAVPTTTVAPPAPTTTVPALPPPPPPPPLPSALSAEVSSAGSIVSGRPGVVVLRAINEGEGPGVDVVVEVDLGELTLRGLPLIAEGTAGRTASWACDSPSPSRLVCRSADVDAASSEAFYVPVLAPGVTGSTEVEVTISGAGDPGASAVATQIPIQASGMAARSAVVDRGGIAFGGNSLVTCPDSHASCADARAGLGTLVDNGSFAMELVDVAPEMAALNSSSASVELPAGAQVLSAQLYWGGNPVGGDGGVPAPDPDQRGNALIRDPGGTVSAVTAERVDVEGGVFQATADVTDLVAAGGGGSWTVGDVQLGSGVGAHGGWALAVVYADDAAPLRSLVLLDGLSRVGSGASVELDLGGFVVPAGGATAATLDVVVHEGDAGLSGDQLTVGDTELFDSSNPLGNTFNSTASYLGAPRPGMDPGHRNLFGLDIDRFDVAGALAPGSTSVTVEFSTSADVYLPGVVAFVVDQ